MDSIKNIIPQVIEGLSGKRPDARQKLEQFWENVLEKKERAHARLIGWREKTISVQVDSPAWLYQMKTKKGKILARLQKEFPEIEDVSFKIGNMK